MTTENQGLETSETGRFYPESLFKICLEYIAKNISLVESLEHLPEIIGNQLFQKCVKNACMSENSKESELALKLFVDAYGQEFCRSFGGISSQLIIEFSECLAILCLPVTHLDLKACKLGNDCDILKVIVDMVNLQVLNIAQNEISEEGFRSLLARYRMFKCGFQFLETLDVSENEVSLKTLKCFLKIPKLKNFRVSLGDSKLLKSWNESIQAHNFVSVPMNPEIVGVIKTEGFSANIVKVWENNVAKWQTERKDKILARSYSFYGSRKRNYECMSKIQNLPIFVTYTYRRKESQWYECEDKSRTSNIEVKRGYTDNIKRKDKKQCKENTEETLDHDTMELLKMYS